MKTEVLMKYFQENCSHKGKISVSKSDLKKVVIANEQFTDEQWTQEKQRERGLRIAFWWEKNEEKLWSNQKRRLCYFELDSETFDITG